jgi:hypothetical protein
VNDADSKGQQRAASTDEGPGGSQGGGSYNFQNLKALNGEDWAPLDSRAGQPLQRNGSAFDDDDDENGI